MFLTSPLCNLMLHRLLEHARFTHKPFSSWPWPFLTAMIILGEKKWRMRGKSQLLIFCNVPSRVLALQVWGSSGPPAHARMRTQAYLCGLCRWDVSLETSRLLQVASPLFFFCCFVWNRFSFLGLVITLGWRPINLGLSLFLPPWCWDYRHLPS